MGQWWILTHAPSLRRWRGEPITAAAITARGRASTRGDIHRKLRGLQGPLVADVEDEVAEELDEGAGADQVSGRTVADSRAHRKHHNLLDTRSGSTWWAPGAVAWWIGVLFMAGSTCFALGALPGYAERVGIPVDSVTFFVGSLFFTSAAFLQYLEVVNAEPSGDRPLASGFRLLSWEPRRIEWWSTLVQLVGTVFFNVSTFAALSSDLSTAQAERFVWRPDVAGSICFLVASGLAWIEVGHWWLSWRPRSTAWCIAALNLFGSVAFGVSAVAAKVVSGSGEVRSAALVNLGTFVGAVCFFAGALLLLPERTDTTESLASDAGP